MSWLKNAFAITKPEAEVLTPRQEEILDRLAAKVIEWKMSAPAILFLESMKPLNFVGSQILVFFGPLANSLFTIKDYDEFVALMEQRGCIEKLLQRIEAGESARTEKRGTSTTPPDTRPSKTTPAPTETASPPPDLG